VDSRPTWNSSSTAPSSARTVNVSLATSPAVSGPPEEDRVAEGDAYEQLAKHGRLAETFNKLARELRAHEHEGQGQQDGGDGVGAMAGPGGRHGQQSVHESLRTMTGRYAGSSSQRDEGAMDTLGGREAGRAASWAWPQGTRATAQVRDKGRCFA
jgi:hypothetical protein